jgi:hypothetical protein
VDVEKTLNTAFDAYKLQRTLQTSARQAYTLQIVASGCFFEARSPSFLAGRDRQTKAFLPESDSESLQIQIFFLKQRLTWVLPDLRPGSTFLSHIGHGMSGPED